MIAITVSDDDKDIYIQADLQNIGIRSFQPSLRKVLWGSMIHAWPMDVDHAVDLTNARSFSAGHGEDRMLLTDASRRIRALAHTLHE